MTSSLLVAAAHLVLMSAFGATILWLCLASLRQERE